MSYSNCYLPQPFRAWSRVQNSCSLITDDNNSGFELVRDPYTNEYIDPLVLAERISMLNKGNVLQYKANSSNLTKSQKYSKIAKGQWVNRNTTWATQSTRGYTNPNTTSLKRTGDRINITIDPITGAIIGPTSAPLTCPTPIVQNNEGLPSNGGGSSIIEPDIPPPVEPKPGSNVFPDIVPEAPVEPTVIQDGGNLICSIQENVCTGEVKRHISQQLCNPTTDSDVPGPVQLLCWNDGNQTWYPRQRYVMTNSTDKFPINYKFLVSAIKPPIPIITASIENCIITLNWYSNDTINNCNCLKITGYNIYINDKVYKKVPANVNSISFFGPSGQYNIYVKSTSELIESLSSNIINVFQSTNVIILEKSNIKYTTFPHGVIIETTFVPTYNGGGQGIAELSSCINHPINILLIAGGGGGGCGNNGTGQQGVAVTPGPGGGGGGGSIININGFTPPVNEKIRLVVGSGGGGKTPGNSGNGNSSGQFGYETHITTLTGTVNCSPGTQGLGAGSTSKGGGNGGTAFGTTGIGYGGGGGGGAAAINASATGGNGGAGYNGGSSGQPGGTGNTSNPGNGGNSGLTSYFVPGLGIVYLGGGGSGGYIDHGGSAGNGFGGSGISSDFSGQNATNYGGGGGGGSKLADGKNNIGGNGANGVIIIWGLI